VFAVYLTRSLIFNILDKVLGREECNPYWTSKN